MDEYELDGVPCTRNEFYAAVAAETEQKAQAYATEIIDLREARFVSDHEWSGLASRIERRIGREHYVLYGLLHLAQVAPLRAPDMACTNYVNASRLYHAFAGVREAAKRRYGV